MTTFARQVQQQALQELTNECVACGMTKEQTYRIWAIVAAAFNRLYQVGAS